MKKSNCELLVSYLVDVLYISTIGLLSTHTELEDCHTNIMTKK